jgi:hypothetical protein
MHGQSEYTATKQKHVMGILNTCQHALKPKSWTHKEVIFIDCTAGSGCTNEGEEGSPLIINRFAATHYGSDFKHLCCEKDAATYAKLLTHSGKMRNVSILCGDYANLIPGWLASQNVRSPAMGVIYCDANGAKDLIDGFDVFRQIADSRLFKCVDLLFHWSLTAYNRNRGAGYKWADDHILKIMDRLVSLKKYAYMRLPVDKHRWVIMHLLNTDKISSVWRSERIVPYQEWRENQATEDQMDLFDDLM